MPTPEHFSDHCPTLLGRLPGDLGSSVHERAPTHLVGSTMETYVSGAVGNVTLELFKSTDIEDRGGYVLRILVQDGGSSFVPHAEQRDDGVDLHFGGEAEGLAALSAIEEVLTATPRPPVLEAVSIEDDLFEEEPRVQAVDEESVPF